MPKSYKITYTEHFKIAMNLGEPLNLTKQLHLNGVVPGPETKIREQQSSQNVLDFRSYSIDHEYAIKMQGRLYEDGTSFGKFIAKGQIMAYQSQEQSLLLLCGRKHDILDFCRRTAEIPEIDLSTVEVDMTQLQEKLPEINGVWFRCRKGYIRAKAFMGQQIQSTSDFKKAKSEGDISTLSFYFEDPHDSSMHPIMITEDGTVVLQGNYLTVEDELNFVLRVKEALLDGLCTLKLPAKSRQSLAGELSHY